MKIAISFVTGALLATTFTATAEARVIGRASASGDYATAVASGSVENPSSIRVRVIASRRQGISVYWSVVCSKGFGAGSKSGQFERRTRRVTRRLRLPMRDPDDCTVSASGSLDRGGRIRVLLLSP
jgi:hypothetical protein